MNDYLFQLAIVTNTSHSKFVDNLLNIIIYIIYKGYLINEKYTAIELEEKIRSNLQLEFNYKEILHVINNGITKDMLIKEERDKYSLEEAGMKRIHLNNENEFDDIYSKRIY